MAILRMLLHNNLYGYCVIYTLKKMSKFKLCVAEIYFSQYYYVMQHV